MGKPGGKPAAINLDIFDNNEDFEDALVITVEGEFVVVTVTMVEEGLGTFELAKLRIHHPVAKKICTAGLTIRQTLRDAKEE